MSAAPGRPKQARTPLGGSVVHTVTSVGATRGAAPSRPKQARFSVRSVVHAVASVGADS